MNRIAAVVAFFALTATVACSDNPVGPREPTELTFAPALNVNLEQMTRTASGLYYLDEVTGTGETVRVGDDVTVHYTGWLHTGVKFDSSYDRQQPLSVSNIGQANLIAGWNQGLPGMREGGLRLLVIPPHLAYGANPPGVIPVHATLVFRVEMLSTAH